MTKTDRQEYWDHVYEEKSPTAVSWFQPTPEPSLLALTLLGAAPTASFIDVGGGASNLVDALLEQGWSDLTVLDIAEQALDASKTRLGPLANKVKWISADITQWKPGRTFDVWHDRAVFHFLTEQEQRDAYRRALTQGTAPGSDIIVATFALDGPEKCSGLPVERYDATTLASELGDKFHLLKDWRDEHVTPWGVAQPFTWCAFRRTK